MSAELFTVANLALLSKACIGCVIRPTPLVHMASVEQLTSELRDLAAFIKAREAIAGDPDSKEKVISNIVASFVAKISGARQFSAQSALVLLTTLCGLHDPSRYRCAAER